MSNTKHIQANKKTLPKTDIVLDALVSTHKAGTYLNRGQYALLEAMRTGRGVDERVANFPLMKNYIKHKLDHALDHNESQVGSKMSRSMRFTYIPDDDKEMPYGSDTLSLFGPTEQVSRDYNKNLVEGHLVVPGTSHSSIHGKTKTRKMSNTYYYIGYPSEKITVYDLTYRNLAIVDRDLYYSLNEEGELIYNDLDPRDPNSPAKFKCAQFPNKNKVELRTKFPLTNVLGYYGVLTNAVHLYHKLPENKRTVKNILRVSCHKAFNDLRTKHGMGIMDALHEMAENNVAQINLEGMLSWDPKNIDGAIARAIKGRSKASYSVYDAVTGFRLFMDQKSAVEVATLFAMPTVESLRQAVRRGNRFKLLGREYYVVSNLTGFSKTPKEFQELINSNARAQAMMDQVAGILLSNSSDIVKQVWTLRTLSIPDQRISFHLRIPLDHIEAYWKEATRIINGQTVDGEIIKNVVSTTIDTGLHKFDAPEAYQVHNYLKDFLISFPNSGIAQG